MAAKTTALFGSDARLVISCFEGPTYKDTLLKELDKSVGISVIVVNEEGFHNPRIRAFSPEEPVKQNKSHLAQLIVVY